MRHGQVKPAGVEGAKTVGLGEVARPAERRGVEEESGGDAHVEALDEPAHPGRAPARRRPRDLLVDARLLVAEDEREPGDRGEGGRLELALGVRADERQASLAPTRRVSARLCLSVEAHFSAPRGADRATAKEPSPARAWSAWTPKASHERTTAAPLWGSYGRSRMTPTLSMRRPSTSRRRARRASVTSGSSTSTTRAGSWPSARESRGSTRSSAAATPGVVRRKRRAQHWVRTRHAVPRRAAPARGSLGRAGGRVAKPLLGARHEGEPARRLALERDGPPGRARERRAGSSRSRRVSASSPCARAAPGARRMAASKQDLAWSARPALRSARPATSHPAHAPWRTPSLRPRVAACASTSGDVDSTARRTLCSCASNMGSSSRCRTRCAPRRRRESRGRRARCRGGEPARAPSRRA